MELERGRGEVVGWLPRRGQGPGRVRVGQRRVEAAVWIPPDLTLAPPAPLPAGSRLPPPLVAAQIRGRSVTVWFGEAPPRGTSQGPPGVQSYQVEPPAQRPHSRRWRYPRCRTRQLPGAQVGLLQVGAPESPGRDFLGTGRDRTWSSGRLGQEGVCQPAGQVQGWSGTWDPCRSRNTQGPQ